MRRWVLQFCTCFVLVGCAFALGRLNLAFDKQVAKKTVSQQQDKARDDAIKPLPVGSQELLIHALVTGGGGLRVSIFFQAGIGDGIWPDNYGARDCLDQPSQVHIEVHSKQLTDALQQLAHIKTSRISADPYGWENIDSMVYFRVTDRRTNKVVYAFSFGQSYPSMWVNGYIAKMDDAFIDVVEPFLPLGEAKNWIKAMR